MPLDPTIEEATLRMIIDGLSVDEIFQVFNGTVARSDLELVHYKDRAKRRQEERIAERIEREVRKYAWRIK